MLHARTGVLARSRRSSSRWWTIISRSADTYSVRLTFNSRMEETRRANTVYRIGWRNQLVKPRERHTHTHTHTRTHARQYTCIRTHSGEKKERETRWANVWTKIVATNGIWNAIFRRGIQRGMRWSGFAKISHPICALTLSSHPRSPFPRHFPRDCCNFNCKGCPPGSIITAGRKTGKSLRSLGEMEIEIFHRVAVKALVFLCFDRATESAENRWSEQWNFYECTHTRDVGCARIFEILLCASIETWRT